MHYPNHTTESPTRLSRLRVFNSTYDLDEKQLDGNLQDVSLTNPESIPFFEFIPATSKSPQRFVGIVGVVILLAVLGISGAIALSSWTRGNGSVLSLVNSPQSLTKDK